MSFTIYVRMKKPGRQRKEHAPVPFVLERKPGTVQELIEALVISGVQKYNAGNKEDRLLPYLTREQISAGASEGKVSFGAYGGNDAVEAEAVENAIQCFEDGIYRIFAGERELAKLNEAIPWQEETVFTLIPLTMLAGW